MVSMKVPMMVELMAVELADKMVDLRAELMDTMKADQ
jgi:hypothetical protein